jgi:hypothetical protein
MIGCDMAGNLLLRVSGTFPVSSGDRHSFVKQNDTALLASVPLVWAKRRYKEIG